MADLREQLAELDRLEREATPAPWMYVDGPPQLAWPAEGSYGSSCAGTVYVQEGARSRRQVLSGTYSEAEAPFIVAARNLARPMLTYIAELEARIARLEAAGDALLGLTRHRAVGLHLHDRQCDDDGCSEYCVVRAWREARGEKP